MIYEGASPRTPALHSLKNNNNALVTTNTYNFLDYVIILFVEVENVIVCQNNCLGANDGAPRRRRNGLQGATTLNAPDGDFHDTACIY